MVILTTAFNSFKLASRQLRSPAGRLSRHRAALIAEAVGGRRGPGGAPPAVAHGLRGAMAARGPAGAGHGGLQGEHQRAVRRHSGGGEGRGPVDIC